jgi:23S rRNA pseudouridine2605 synthase
LSKGREGRRVEVTKEGFTMDEIDDEFGEESAGEMGKGGRGGRGGREGGRERGRGGGSGGHLFPKARRSSYRGRRTPGSKALRRLHTGRHRRGDGSMRGGRGGGALGVDGKVGR